MEKVPRKQNEMKVCRMAGQKKTLESIWFIQVILQVRWKLRPQGEPKTSLMAHGELGTEPGWPRNTPAHPPGLSPLCYTVSRVERQHRKNEEYKKGKVG